MQIEINLDSKIETEVLANLTNNLTDLINNNSVEINSTTYNSTLVYIDYNINI